jgi:hypothetical protein
MNRLQLTRRLKNELLIALGIGVLVPAVAFSSVYASSTTSSPGSNTTAAKTLVSTIISKGNNEINRRLTTLNSLASKISSSTKISASDKTTLTNEVNSEVSGLSTLKTTLDACTTLSCAKSSAQSIFSEYRVYALVVPQVDMIKAADNQQLTEAKLATIASQLNTRLSSSSSSNSTLLADLTTMNSDISSAQSLSSTVESAVEGFTPANYDSDHSLLSQYYQNLKSAQTDIQAAYTQGKAIAAALK